MSFTPSTTGVVVISEIGINFNSPEKPTTGDLNMAYRLIAEAAEAGADYVKFQLYDPAKVFPDNKDLRNEAEGFHIKRPMWKALVEYMKTFPSITPLASVFDLERFQWCEELGLRAYKIASRSVEDRALCEAVISTEKAVFMSLGAWDWKVKGLPYTNPNVYYLECISKYPPPISDLSKLDMYYNSKIVGYSDHIKGMSGAFYAISQGAHVIEKHFTWDRGAPGSDHAGSMTKDDLAGLKKFGEDVKTIRRS